MVFASAALAGASAAEDWPTYLHDDARSATSGETAISAANAAQLTRLWRFQTDGGVAASPTVVGGVVYVGSWDGYEYALDAVDGTLKWRTFLGITSDPECHFPQVAGITSSATVRDGVVYVGGGDSFFYALDAQTGAVLWTVFTGDNSPTGGHYNWSSPLIYNGSAYIGISSFGDCPLTQGKLLRVDLSTRQVVATFEVVPDGQVGGTIWTSPTVDAATNTIFVTTGGPDEGADQPYASSMVALDATTLAPKGSWQVPADQRIADGDWANTPTLIGGGLVVATHKNGLLYAFQRSDISAGPVWQHRIADGGGCSVCGENSVSSSAFDGTRLYAAGGRTTINGTPYPGSIQGIDAATGGVVWSRGLQSPVIPALSVVNGLVLAGVGSDFSVFNAATGAPVFSYATGATIFSPVAVSGGRAYLGSQDGFVYAFGLPSSVPPAPPNTVRVNAGGPTYIDSSAGTWSADCCNSGGNVFSTNSPIAGTTDQELYQTIRWASGPFTYTFTGLAPGAYTVKLKFAEIAYVGPGNRQFNVAINGTRVLTNLDVAAQVGFNAAHDETLPATVGSNGQLTVTFSQGAADNPMVGAIQVAPAASGSLSFASPPQTLTAGQPSAPMQVRISSPRASDTSVTLASNSSAGRFSTSSGGPFSTSLAVTVPAGQTVSGSFFYRDTTAGSPRLTATASGFTTASQTETVTAAALATIAVTPPSVTLSPGTSQLLTAAGSDQFGNGVDVSGAGWTTTAPGSVSPASGQATTFTAGSSTGSGTVTAQVGAIAGSASVTVAIAATSKRVNAGGPSYVDTTGKTWSADCCFSGGTVFTTTAPITGTNDPTLYQAERWASGTFTYTFTGLAAGPCQVTLKFAEIAGLGPGQRKFNVAINGTQVLTDFDVSAQVGQFAALDRTFAASVGATGQLTVTFSRGAVDNPIVSAIEVVSASGTLSFAGPPQTLTAGQPSAPMQIAISSAPQSNLPVALSSSSSSGEFATSTSGPWSATLTRTIAAGQTTSPSFFYRDTKAGTPTLTASASGASNATQTQTVNPAALASINVSPSSASVIVGFTQAFTASGADQFGNAVAVNGATWSTTVAGGSVSPTSGASTTFTAGLSTGSGSVTARVGTITSAASVTVVPLPAPSGLTAAAQGRGKIRLTWQPSAAGVTYNVFRGTASGQQGSTPYRTGITATTFTDQQVNAGTTYHYYVVARGPGGSTSSPSNEASATAR